MTQKVPISDTGTATLGISAARQRRRNSSTTSTTRPTAMTSVSSASCNEARMLGVRSCATDILTSAGISADSMGSWARTASTVSMMLASAWRRRIIRMALRSLKKPVW